MSICKLTTDTREQALPLLLTAKERGHNCAPASPQQAPGKTQAGRAEAYALLKPAFCVLKRLFRGLTGALTEQNSKNFSRILEEKIS